MADDSFKPDSFRPDAADSFKADAAPTASLGGFLRNAGNSALRFVSNIGNAVIHPGETLEGVTGLLEGMAEKTGSPAVNGQSHQPYVDALVKTYKDRYGSFEGLKNALYTDPVGVAADISALADGAGVIGKGVQAAADAAKLGTVADVAGATAKAAGTVSAATNPLKVAGKIADATGLSGVPGKVANAAADSLTRGALRGGFNTTTNAGNVADAISTMRESNLPLTEAGKAAIEQSLRDLQQQKIDLVDRAALSGVGIDPRTVNLRLQDLASTYGSTAYPDRDLKAIQKVQQSFTARHPGPILADEAEALKEGTYAKHPEAFGPDAAIPPTERAGLAAEKTVALTLKDELERQIPELGSINAEQAKKLNLQGIFQSALTKYLNSGGFTGNLMSAAADKTGKVMASLGGGAALYFHSPELAAGGAAAVLMHGVLSDPMLKSQLARAINLAQQANPGKYGVPNVANAISRIENYQKALQPQQ